MIWGPCSFPYAYSGFGCNYWAPPIDTYAAGRYIAHRGMAAANIFYPYIFATPWGSAAHEPGTTYQEAVVLNQMMYDPYHMPDVSALCRGGNNSAQQIADAQAKGVQWADRTILKVTYNSVKNNVDNIVKSAEQHLNSDDLTDDQKKELQAIKETAEALQKKIADFAEKSKNMDVRSAIVEVDKLQKEYNDLYKRIQTFNTAVAKNKTNGNNGTNGNDGVDGNNGVNGNDGNNGNSEIKDLESLKKAYDESTKPAIDELMKNPKLSAEDKKKIEEKQKELEKAIQENKPFEEIKKLYDELGEMVTGIQDKINKAVEQEAEQSKKELAENCNKLNENIGELVQEDVSLVPKKDKKVLQEALKELQDAIVAGKSQEEIEEIYGKVNAIYTRIKRSADRLKEEATNIAEQIATAADGADWTSSQEGVIQDNVLRLNSKNIMAFLHVWDKDFKSNFGDRCVLETIFGEFQMNSTAKKHLSNHIFNAMEQYAKDNGIYNQIGGKLSAVRALCKDLGLFTSYAPIYAKFNELFISFKQALS